MHICRVSLKSVIFSLIFLYPILPVNYYVGPIGLPLLCSIFIILLSTIINGKVQILKFKKYNILFWMYLFIYMFFCFFTASILTGGAWLITEILVPMSIVFLIKTEDDFFRIVDLIIYAAIPLGLMGIYEALSGNYLFQADLLSGWSDSVRYGLTRCTVTFGHPINFALFQSIAALLAFYRLNSGLIIKNKRKYRIAYTLALTSLFMSVSRLAICFFIAAQILMILRLGVTRTFKYICVAVLLICVGITFAEVVGLDVYSLFGDFFVSIGNLLGLNVDNSNAKGFGNRLDLYGWVIVAVGHDFIFGKGINAVFEHELASWLTKTSIEVHYLLIYFRCGLVGLSSLLASYIGTLVYFGKRVSNKFVFENRLSFINVLLIILVCYYICLLGVQETDLVRIYCELIALSIGYLRIYKRKDV